MAKQCPRCWDKVEPGTTVCPNCGYNFNRNANAADKGADETQKKSVFPRGRKDYSAEDGTNYIFLFINLLLIIWAVLALLGGITNLMNDSLIQGAGLTGSGIICGVAAYYMHLREHPGICWLLVLVSAAATLQIPTLVVGAIVAFLVYSCKPYFNGQEN